MSSATSNDPAATDAQGTPPADAGTSNPGSESQHELNGPAIATISTPSFPPTPSRSSSFERNQAPGILDRRKTVKQGPSRSSSRTSNKSGIVNRRGGPPIRVTMADIGSELRAKDGETPGTESDTFEDAVDVATPKALSPEPVREEHGSMNGLAIDGAEEVAQSVVHTNGDGTHSRQVTLDTAPELLSSKPALPDRDMSVSPTKHLHGLSGDFAVATPPPPSSADRVRALESRPTREKPTNLAAPRPQAEGLARKASSGFAGLLGRMGSIRKPARSPPAPRQESRFAAAAERKGTISSVDGASVSGSLASIADESESGSTTSSMRPSLKEQFRDLRRQEELATSDANGHAVDGGSDGDAERTPIARTRSDAGILDISSERAQPSPPRLGRSESTPNGLLKSPPLDQNLPPGTASGISAGPADEPRAVNWDLWQSVVYEGPAAVKRTGGSELQEAIASGIPAAIRGVVWQVLAESKNEELEAVYRTLKVKGTDAEQQPPLKPSPMSRSDSQNGLLTNGHGKDEGESVQSSRSSTHSEQSTPATSAMASPPLSSVNGGNDPMDAQGKLLAEKQKREAAALAKLEKCIKRDLGARTSFSKYASSAGLQDSLFGVCKSYALFDGEVGYAQGINFIAMPLLFLMGEEEAFTLLVKMMGGSKYDLRSMFVPDMHGLHLRLYQFERLLEDVEPALYCHLKRRKVDPGLYATQWFLTLFAYRFPLQLVLRVYDLILSEGLTTAILRFGIVLMQRNRETLLAMRDMSALSTFLKERVFDVYIDKSPSAASLLDGGFFGSVSGGADKELYRADEMVRDACEVLVTDEQLAEYGREWEETQRVEKERTEEVESLRVGNAQLSSRLKALEERTQQQDTEHVTLAGELVRGKVELDSVMDENEGLKMKMQELEKLVEAQPREVEERLKEEMDRIMARNLEVQNENRGLKEEMEEMERELVEAKMGLAQAQADRDAMQKRWANLQAHIAGQ
ncbi:hypothetical protein LTR56_006317 [Elasticomyces elasticus]|nr:hypothetical protein LTR56_006317 [Elasticomyces elasticus]KAK3663365.1 hypothetical protein LTR22_005772 [Elasticomyces elasticus]KAK4925444.1 hypothetical protein LTR49_007508 [Elasticomyces elasticus]KAK5764539.1 hypothetical protein LTS12_005269 [Elasticomyces elasticus]